MDTDCTATIVHESYENNKIKGAMLPLAGGIAILIILACIYIPIMILIWKNRRK